MMSLHFRSLMDDHFVRSKKKWSEQNPSKGSQQGGGVAGWFAHSSRTNMQMSIWVCPKIVGFPPKWMVKIMENPIKNGSFGGYHYFRKHPYGNFEWCVLKWRHSLGKLSIKHVFFSEKLNFCHSFRFAAFGPPLWAAKFKQTSVGKVSREHTHRIHVMYGRFTYMNLVKL